MNQIDIRVSEIPKEALDRPARALLAAVGKAFQDPAVAADFERWLAERQQSQKSHKISGTMT